MPTTEPGPAPGMPRRRPRREDVRAGLLVAALEEFVETGYAATTLTVVAHRAGYTKGAVYSNFGSKQGLFSALLADRLATITAGVLEGTAGASTVEELTDRAAERLAREIVEGRRFLTLVTEFAVHAARDPDVAAEVAHQWTARREALAAALAESGSRFGRSDDPSHYSVSALTLLATINGLSLELAVDPDAVSATELTASLSAVLRTAMR